MGNFLKNNQKSDLRVVISDDIILYEPTSEQKEGIRKIIFSQIEATDGVNVEGEINYDVIRYIVRECVKYGAFIDEYTDDQIEDEFENGNINIKKLKYEIFDLIDEVLQEFQYEVLNMYKDINSIINVLSSNIEENKMYEKIQKLFKKQKINMDINDIIKHKDNPNKITELLEIATSKKNNKSRNK